MGLLADAFSYGDSLKRKVGGLLADPVGTIELGINRLKEDNNNTLNLFANAYPMAGDKTVLNTPAQKARFQKQAADYAASVGLAGSVYLPSGRLSASIDDANALAQKIKDMGLTPKIEEAMGGSVYVTVSKPNLTKSGSISKRNPETPIMSGAKPFKARFADHPNYWDSSISSDPFTGNTADDAFELLKRQISGDPIGRLTQAKFVPGVSTGQISEISTAMAPSLSGKSIVPKTTEEVRRFSFLGDDYPFGKSLGFKAP